MTRRQLLAAGGALIGARLVPGLVRAQPAVRPRDAWGADLPPTGPLAVEAPEDVRFLIVHHTVTGNDYAPDAVRGILRSIYRHHTTASGWPDVAYNFFVDRFGSLWEGRAGSLREPVRGDATGGSQGFALLCAFIGDHRAETPSDAAVAGMALLLSQLAQRYRVDPTGTTSFASRGSNRWPAGAEVVTPTIAGHRDMSLTECPGDAAYTLVTDLLPGRVAGLLPPSGTPAREPQPAHEPTPAREPTPPQAAPPPAPRPEPDRGRGWLAAAAASLAAGTGAAIAAARRAGGRGSTGSGPLEG